MAELPGADAPVVDAPVANTVPAPESPTPPEEAKQETVKTYTEEELRQKVSERLSKERRRIERTVKAELEADFWRNQAQKQQQPPPQARSDGRPREEDFQGKPYSEYVEKLAEWKAEKLFETKLAAREQETKTQTAQRQAAEQAQKVKEKLSAGADEYPDFEEVALADHVPITQAMAHAIAESDVPARVAYYLGSHLDEAKRISQLPPTQQIRAIAKIESTLSEPPPTSKAPPPIRPSSPKASGEIDPDKLSGEEWLKWRQNDLKRKRSGK